MPGRLIAGLLWATVSGSVIGGAGRVGRVVLSACPFRLVLQCVHGVLCTVCGAPGEARARGDAGR